MFDELTKAHEDWQRFDYLMKANLAPIFPVSTFVGASFLQSANFLWGWSADFLHIFTRTELIFCVVQLFVMRGERSGTNFRLGIHLWKAMRRRSCFCIIYTELYEFWRVFAAHVGHDIKVFRLLCKYGGKSKLFLIEFRGQIGINVGWVLLHELPEACWKPTTKILPSQNDIPNISILKTLNEFSTFMTEKIHSIILVFLDFFSQEMVKDGAAKIHIYGALGKVPSSPLRKRALEYNLSGAVRSQARNRLERSFFDRPCKQKCWDVAHSLSRMVWLKGEAFQNTEVCSFEQDLIYIPMGMASSGKDGAEAVFSWMQDQYDRIYELKLWWCTISCLLFF